MFVEMLQQRAKEEGRCEIRILNITMHSKCYTGRQQSLFKNNLHTVFYKSLGKVVPASSSPPFLVPDNLRAF